MKTVTPATSGLDYAELATDFLNSLDASPQTARTYREALKNFLRWLGKKDTVTLTDMKAYKEWLRLERAANTVATYLVALRRFFQFCVNEGYISSNPVDHVKSIRRPRGHLRQDVPREGIRLLFSAVDRNTSIGKRDFAIINLMVRNGLRVIEVHRANVGDIESKQGRQILRVFGKGRDERDEFVVLTEPAIQAIQDFLTCRKDIKSHDPLFTGLGGRNKGKRITTRTISRQVNSYMIRSGVKNKKTSPHSLRHSFVTLAIQGGASIVEAQVAARHRSIETTRVYFHEHDRLDAPVEDKIEI
ncbi:site-specific integrase [Candidatus Acetothermia bacterium]|nr:site-specific integrase [Candidatus Acetothermia bacterium]